MAKHMPSAVLTSEENESIFSLLSRGKTALATAVVQLLMSCPPAHQEWKLFATGVMCFIKNNQKRSYYFCLYDFNEKKAIWEQEIYININYIRAEKFHMFEAENNVVALNFADENDAKNFAKVVKQKSDLINQKMNEKQKRDGTNHSNRQLLEVPNIPTRARSLDSLQTNKVSKKSSKSSFKSKPKVTKLEIGLPTNFRHIQHIGWSPSTGFDLNVIDPKLENFFEIAGVSADLLDDFDTRKFIFNFIDTHGGIEAAIQETAQSKKNKQVNIPNICLDVPQPKCTPLSPLPPPPPPPPPPSLNIMSEQPNSENISSLAEELKVGKSLNRCEPSLQSTNTTRVADSRDELLEAIRSGISLKSASKPRKDTQLQSSKCSESSGTLADALSKALQNRLRVNQMVNTLSDDSESDNEFDSNEWDD